MSEFLCYAVQSTDPEIRKPVSWCIMGNGKIWTGLTLEYTKSQALLASPFAKFVDNCGWILIGEEQKLLDVQYQDILLFGLQIRGIETT